MKRFRANGLRVTWVVFMLAALGACSGGGGGSSSSSSTTKTTNPYSTGTPDTTPPSVTSVSPQNGATKVPVNGKVTATFNETLLTANEAQFYLVNTQNSERLYDASVSYDPSTSTATLTPYVALQEYTTYQATLWNIMDQWGNIMPDYTWTFRTRDLTAPQTTSSVTGTLFNTPVTVTLTCADPNGSGCANTYYSTDGSTPANRYTAPFVLGEGNWNLRYYSVDNEANAETASAAQQFRIDLTPPKVVSNTPANGATAINLRANLTATFSEDMAPASVTRANFTLSNNLSGTVTYDTTTKTATLVPSRRLTCGTPYTATVTMGVTDLAGNHLAAPYSWNFTTDTDCDEPVTTASPAGSVITASSATVSLTCTDSVGCSRIVYTTDGTMPTFEPANGTIVTGGSATVVLPEGAHRLRFFAEDGAGNREIPREEQYVVSTSGVLHVATSNGIARGAGPNPDKFVFENYDWGMTRVFKDVKTGRLYKVGDILMYSDNAGYSWRALDILPKYAYKIYSIYASGARILVGTDYGLIVSDDGLVTANYIRQSDGLGSDQVNDIVVKDNMVYVATSYGLSVSSDYGYHFVTRRTTDSGLGDDDVRAIFVDGATVYAATAGGLSISTDGGNTFVNRTTLDGLGSNDVRDVSASGQNVYAATYGSLSISNDGGATFAPTTGGQFSSSGIYTVLLDGTTLYAGTENGMSVSTDGGATFTNHIPFPGRVVDLFSDGTSVYALSSNVAWTSDGGLTFTRRGLNGSPRALYVSGPNVYVAVDGGMAISADGGSTFVARTPANGIGSTDATSVTMASGKLYLGTKAGLSVSSDAPAFTTFTNMTAANSGLASDIVHDLASDGTYVYAATDNGLSVSKPSKGGSFTNYLVSDVPNPEVDDVYIDSGNVYVTTPWRFSHASLADITNWTYLPFAQPTDVYAHGSVIHIDESAGVTNANFYSSFDGGASFNVNSAVGYNYGFDISGWDSYVYLGAGNGLQVSTDDGRTFTTKGPFMLENFYPDNLVTDAAYTP